MKLIILMSYTNTYKSKGHRSLRHLGEGVSNMGIIRCRIANGIIHNRVKLKEINSAGLSRT
jgi:hypothetical protein